MSLQRTGEREDSKLVNQAKSANDSRRMMKQFKSSHADLNKGEDVRNPKNLIDMKKKRIQQKFEQKKHEMRQSGK